MPTQIKKESIIGKEARDKILEGVNKVANAVKVTMGAKGRTVLTSYRHATKDGVTVARDIDIYQDPAAQQGANLIKAASVRTCDVAGDGTTQVCVLAQSMIEDGYKLIDKGKSPQDLRKEMEEQKPVILDALAALSHKTDDIRHIANVSANDDAVGAIVAEAVNAVGVDGLVTVENTYGDTQIETVEGMQFDKGVFLTSFLTDAQRRKAEYEDVNVIIYKGQIHDLHGFAKVIEALAKEGKAMLVIADDFDMPVLRMLELSRIQAGLRILPVRAPHIYHDDVLEDIAVYTGGVVIFEADGFKNFNRSWVGHVKSVISTPDRTIMRADDAQREAIDARVETIYEDAKGYTDVEKRNREKRASRLKGKMAIVKVNATTEEERKELRDRVEDAIFASQAALETGIIPGGGLSYLKASQAITSETDGARLLRQALEMPMRQIAKNAGKNDADIVKEARATGLGYNVVSEKFEDLLSTGIVDPLKVATTAFSNALSVAVLAITTDVVNTETTVETKFE